MVDRKWRKSYLILTLSMSLFALVGCSSPRRSRSFCINMSQLAFLQKQVEENIQSSHIGYKPDPTKNTILNMQFGVNPNIAIIVPLQDTFPDGTAHRVYSFTPDGEIPTLDMDSGRLQRGQQWSLDYSEIIVIYTNDFSILELRQKIDKRIELLEKGTLANSGATLEIGDKDKSSEK